MKKYLPIGLYLSETFPLRKFIEYVHFIAIGFNYLLLVPSNLSMWLLMQIKAAPSLPSCVL